MLFHLSIFHSILYIHGLVCRLIICSQLSFPLCPGSLSHPIGFVLGQDLLWLVEYKCDNTPHLNEQTFSMCLHDLALRPLSDTQDGGSSM